MNDWIAAALLLALVLSGALGWIKGQEYGQRRYRSKWAGVTFGLIFATLIASAGMLTTMLLLLPGQGIGQTIVLKAFGLLFFWGMYRIYMLQTKEQISLTEQRQETILVEPNSIAKPPTGELLTRDQLKISLLEHKKAVAKAISGRAIPLHANKASNQQSQSSFSTENADYALPYSDQNNSSKPPELPATFSFEYANADGEIKFREVLVRTTGKTWDGRLYLEGICLHARAKRTFRLDRILGSLTSAADGATFTARLVFDQSTMHSQIQTKPPGFKKLKA